MSCKSRAAPSGCATPHPGRHASRSTQHTTAWFHQHPTLSQLARFHSDLQEQFAQARVRDPELRSSRLDLNTLNSLGKIAVPLSLQLLRSSVRDR